MLYQKRCVIIKKDEHYIIIFKSANESIALLNILRNKGYNIRIISAPCLITKGCARAIKFNYYDLDHIREEIKNSNINILGIYKKTYNGYKIDYTKIAP
ncbi:DUF3343 domain-containing protein [Clostridium sp. MB40-C1]|uniref:DUF3343 domain-containing protein n=1 Tax=Clostridium sp. MB40-C1 TaxID=3070996 RepID=UPI0027DF6E5F|nr:DUF3343 domain-containing protein [Clostridium sp. MB40-C1]WMJ81118.1 DUF3343 domain-containing protein [Clostridium sp. MB40-C1]